MTRIGIYSLGLAVALSSASVIGCSAAYTSEEDEIGQTEAALSTDEPYFVRLHVIVTRNTGADDDDAVKADAVTAMIDQLNGYYLNGPLKFQFDPASDYERVASTVLNEDFPRDSNGEYIIIANSANNPNVTAQNQRARQHPGKAVIYFRDWTAEMDQAGMAIHFASYGEFSYSRMAKVAPTITTAHEIGHYFNLAHTHFGDGDGLSDTPRDPGPDAFVDAGLDPCGPVASVTVGGVTYTPARNNLMSYYGCSNMTYRISNQQAARVRATIETGLYTAMVAQPGRYDAVFYKPAIPKTQSNVFGWELAHVINLNTTKVAAGQNLVAFLSYDIGGGQRRYDAVWQQGAPATSFITGWEQAHFLNQDNALRSQGYRLLTVQSYATPAGRRYDAVWRISSTQQHTVVGWERAHVENLATELSGQGYILGGLHSYDIGGGARRYDAFFNRTNQSSRRVFGWRQDHVNNNNTQLGATWGLVAVETYEQAPRQVRYDAIWEPTTVAVPHVPALNYRLADLQKAWTSLKNQGYMLKTLRVRND